MNANVLIVIVQMIKKHQHPNPGFLVNQRIFLCHGLAQIHVTALFSTSNVLFQTATLLWLLPTFFQHNRRVCCCLVSVVETQLKGYPCAQSHLFDVSLRLLAFLFLQVALDELKKTQTSLWVVECKYEMVYERKFSE